MRYIRKKNLRLFSIGIILILGICVLSASVLTLTFANNETKEVKKSEKENDIIAMRHSLEQEWTLVHDGRGVKAYPELREYVWEKVPNQLPNGPYDKIGLHRVVKEGIKPKGVVFFCPGTWSSGEHIISNPIEEPWKVYENYSAPLFLANRGFDVYAIDYRTHFVPINLEPENLSFMVNWGWDQWISDIKEAVDLAKEISGAKRIYIAGESFGGFAAMNFASLYWKEYLKGIILLDGGTGTKYPELVTNSYNLPEEIDNMITSEAWSMEIGGPGGIFIMQEADKNPEAPSPVPGFDNITDFAAYMIYILWGPGGVSNIYEGYGNPSVMIHINAYADRYWPSRLTLETSAIMNWNACPYVTNDFDDNYHDIDVPLIAFASELFSNRTGFFRFRNGIANPDFTGIMLEGYGHLDVYAGEYSETDVKIPTYEWLISHKMLVGWCLLNIVHNWHFGNLIIYINSTAIDIKINGIRVSWNLIEHVFLKKLEIEVYKGENDSGRIVIAIFNICIAIVVGGNILIIAYVV